MITSASILKEDTADADTISKTDTMLKLNRAENKIVVRLSFRLRIERNVSRFRLVSRPVIDEVLDEYKSDTVFSLYHKSHTIRVATPTHIIHHKLHFVNTYENKPGVGASPPKDAGRIVWIAV